jgi:hypothetical protein
MEKISRRSGRLDPAQIGLSIHRQRLASASLYTGEAPAQAASARALRRRQVSSPSHRSIGRRTARSILTLFKESTVVRLLDSAPPVRISSFYHQFSELIL